MFKRIDHTAIISAKTQETVEFYTGVLGFKLKDRTKIQNSPPVVEITFLQLGDTNLKIIGVSASSAPTAEPWMVSYKRISLEVTDMAKAISHLKSQGVKMTMEPSPTAATKRAEFLDPNGLTIELRQW